MHSAAPSDSRGSTEAPQQPTTRSMSLENLVSGLPKLHVSPAPPADPEFANADDLRKRIVAALKDDSQDSVDGYIVTRFFNVSEADCDYVMLSVAPDDKLVRKPSYAPDLQRFIVQRPCRILNSVLTPMRRLMKFAIDPLPINKQWDLHFSLRMAPFLIVRGRRLGVPDILLELQGPAGVTPLWYTDVTSEEEEELTSKFRRITEKCKDLLMVTIIDVRELAHYKQPKDSSDMELSIKGRDLLTCLPKRNGGEDAETASFCCVFVKQLCLYRKWRSQALKEANTIQSMQAQTREVTLSPSQIYPWNIKKLVSINKYHNETLNK